MNFYYLLLAHFIGDFVLQGDYLAFNKGKSLYLLFVHSMIWTGLVLIAKMQFGNVDVWDGIFLVLGHMLIDSAAKDNTDSAVLMIDQILHVVQLVIIYFK